MHTVPCRLLLALRQKPRPGCRIHPHALCMVEHLRLPRDADAGHLPAVLPALRRNGLHVSLQSVLLAFGSSFFQPLGHSRHLGIAARLGVLHCALHKKLLLQTPRRPREQEASVFRGEKVFGLYVRRLLQ